MKHNSPRKLSNLRGELFSPIPQGEIICKWLIITYLRGCFTLFHYFTLQDEYGWLICIVWGMGD